MTRFRPCIDLHAGSVKQIVGAYFAELYKENNLKGGHVIMLGPGNEEAARQALSVWPGGLQVGGGIKDSNARTWIEAGAERVIITSFLFPAGSFSLDRLQSVLEALGGDKNKLVIDLSCRRVNDGWRVAMDKWQTITDFEIDKANIALLEPYCSEFLIHAADAEGLQAGIDEKLVQYLATICGIPVTYAGGGRHIQDLELVEQLSDGKIDLTIGSALDIFGGKTVTFDECCEWNSKRE